MVARHHGDRIGQGRTTEQRAASYEGTVSDTEEQSAPINRKLYEAIQGIRRGLPQQGSRKREFDHHPARLSTRPFRCLLIFARVLFPPRQEFSELEQEPFGGSCIIILLIIRFRSCVSEADGERTIEVPVHQEGEEKLVPDRPHRQIQKVEVAEKRGIRDGERKFGLVNFHFRRIFFILQGVNTTLCAEFFEGLILRCLLMKRMLMKKTYAGWR